MLFCTILDVLVYAAFRGWIKQKFIHSLSDVKYKAMVWRGVVTLKCIVKAQKIKRGNLILHNNFGGRHTYTLYLCLFFLNMENKSSQ